MKINIDISGLLQYIVPEIVVKICTDNNVKLTEQSILNLADFIMKDLNNNFNSDMIKFDVSYDEITNGTMNELQKFNITKDEFYKFKEILQFCLNKM